jgi:exopolysaccharide biosynthesis protein
MKKNMRNALIGMGLFLGSLPINAQTITTINQNNTTLVQLKVIGEGLGAQVAYNAQTKIVSVVKEEVKIEFTPNSAIARVNGSEQKLLAPAQVIDGSTYVPIRFIAENLGGQIELKGNNLSVILGGVQKEWTIESLKQNAPSAPVAALTVQTKMLQGRSVKYVVVNPANAMPTVQTASGKINKVQSVGEMAKAAGGVLAINGTYFDAYDGKMPLPNGTVVKNKETVYITDVGSTIGFTAEGKVLIDFVTTRIQGYKNGQEAWVTYRVNRPSPADPSATVIYTKEYEGTISLDGKTAVICENQYVVSKKTGTVTVPTNGFVLVMDGNRANQFSVGDHVTYETNFTPKTDSKEEWSKVVHAISAGPSLLKNGSDTPNPNLEGFTEAKILTQVAQRSFIGTTSDGRVIVGTSVASVSELKKIAKELGLQNAMCLDGGGSSALYVNNNYTTGPGRNVNNAIVFVSK